MQYRYLIFIIQCYTLVQRNFAMLICSTSQVFSLLCLIARKLVCGEVFKITILIYFTLLFILFNEFLRKSSIYVQKEWGYALVHPYSSLSFITISFCSN
jgi:hypothetical protein